MLLIEKIEYQPFSNSEQAVINYILEKKLDIEHQTTTEIAAATFSSKSTLVRTAKKLGFSGWQEFKVAFIKELTYLNSNVSQIDANLPFQKTDNIQQITNQLAALKKEVIEDTQSLLSYKTLNKAIRTLSESQTIHIFATSNNNLLPLTFQQKMSRIRRDVRVHSLEGEQYFDAYQALPNSCALLISYSGETSSLLKVAKILHLQNIPIILLTSIGENSISELADCRLFISTKEKLYSKIATFTTDESILYLLDVLYSGIFALNYDENLAFKIKAASFIEANRQASSSIMEEEST